MASSAQSNHLQRGYVAFSGDAAQYVGWISLMRALMYEADLGRVMSGAEKAPTDVGDDSNPAQISAHERSLRKFQEKNGKPYTRLLLTTSDCTEGNSLSLIHI